MSAKECKLIKKIYVSKIQAELSVNELTRLLIYNAITLNYLFIEIHIMYRPNCAQSHSVNLPSTVYTKPKSNKKQISLPTNVGSASTWTTHTLNAFGIGQAIKTDKLNFEAKKTVP